MNSEAKKRFDNNLSECEEAIQIYAYLKTKGYNADFGLRFVWVAGISALDHYVTEIVVEKGTEIFANGNNAAALLSMPIIMETAIALKDANPVDAILIFKQAISDAVRYKSFQKAEDVVSGLAYIWSEKHKWQTIGRYLGKHPKVLRETLNNIVSRRNIIVHNADFVGSENVRKPVDPQDAKEVVFYLKELVRAIDQLVA